MLRRDLIAASGDNQILLTVDDRQEAILIECADVARMEPAVFLQCFGRSFGIVVIAREDAWPSRQDFAVWRDTDLVPRIRGAYRPNTEIVEFVDGQCCSGFRQSPCLNHGDAYRMKKCHNGRIDWRTPAQGKLKPSAESCPQTAENKPVSDGKLQAQAERNRSSRLAYRHYPLPHLQRPVEKQTLRS